MFCNSCGNKLNPDSRFCNGCGAPVVGSTVEVLGKVSVDNYANLDNLYKLARRARDENNTDKAAQYYEQILLNDPNNWEPTFYSTYYLAIQKCTNSEITASIYLLENCFDNVINLIKDIKDYDELKLATEEISKKVAFIASLLHDIIKDEWTENLKYLMKIPTDGVVDFVKGQKMRSDNEKERDTRYRMVDDMYNSLKRKLETLEIEKEKEIKEHRMKEYWDINQPQKKALDSEKQSLIEQIDNFNKEISSISGLSEIENLNRQIWALNLEKEGLGFLKFKEKKAKQEQIYSINNELLKVRSSVCPAVDEINKHISKLKNRIKDIDTELNKPR